MSSIIDMFRNDWNDVANTSEVTDTDELFSGSNEGNNDGVITKWNYQTIRNNFNIKGQDILRKEYNAGKDGTNSKNRWKELYGKDTCAIKLSWALNHAGYIIPEHETINGRSTWTSNINSDYEYILGADEMGHYLKSQLGVPTFKSNGAITSDKQLEEFIEEIEKWKDYAGLIYLDAKNHKEYGATGHVDLVYEDWGNDPYIVGSGEELDDYVDWRNGDGWFNSDAQLEVSIWLLKGEKRKK